MNDISNVWQMIRDARDAHGWTNERLADASGIPESTLQKFLSGKTADPRFENVVRLCAALDLSVDALCGIEADTSAAAEKIRQQQTDLLIANERIKAAEASKTAAEAKTEAGAAIIEEKDKTIRRLIIFVIVIGTLFVALVAAVVGILIYDITHLDRGWFQMAAQYFQTGIGAIRKFFV